VGGGYGQPPPQRLGCAHTLPSAHTIIKIQSQFQIKFQTYLEFIINDNFLRLMFVYTSSDVYLTPRFYFCIYLSNFGVKFSYKRNNAVDDQ
jgi:hypothetical protein